MCSPSNRVIVHQVIDDFVSQNRMFTAFDVTSEAKNRGADERHLLLKSAVHERWYDIKQSGYSRELIDIPNDQGDVQAWLYRPDNASAQDYLNALQNPSQQTAPTIDPTAPVYGVGTTYFSTPPTTGSSAAVMTIPTPVGLTPVGKTIAHETDREGRLNLGVAMLKELNVVEGDIVGIGIDKTDGITAFAMSDAPSLGIVPSKQYAVNHDGRIRISAAVLAEAGYDGIDSFDIHLFQNASGVKALSVVPS